MISKIELTTEQKQHIASAIDQLESNSSRSNEEELLPVQFTRLFIYLTPIKLCRKMHFHNFNFDDKTPQENLTEKSLFYMVLFLMVIAFSSVDSRPVIPKDLVLYWSFDNPTVKGKAVKDVLGKRDRRLEGNPKVSAGKFAQGLEFNGKSDFATMDQIDLGDFTVEAWFKALSPPGTWSRIFDFGKGDPGDFFVTPNHGRTGNDIAGGCHFSGGGRVDFGSGEKTKVGTWYHVALSFDKGGEGIKLYLNAEMKKHEKFNKESFEDWGEGQNWYYRRIANLQSSLE